MFDIGWSEMLIVGVVALVVVGPKDLPKMFHALGEFTAKARGMAREFQRAMDVAAKEAGVDSLAKDIRKVTSGRAIKEAVGFDEIEKEFRDIGREASDIRKSPKAQTMPKTAAKPDPNAPGAKAGGDAPVSAPTAVPAFDDEDEIDEIEVRDHDADLEARNAQMSAVEEQRLIRARKIAESRQQAAEIRARREAAEAEAAAAGREPREWRPKTSAKATPTPTPEAAPQPEAQPDGAPAPTDKTT